jgi:hypothetical protein
MRGFLVEAQKNGVCLENPHCPHGKMFKTIFFQVFEHVDARGDVIWSLGFKNIFA